MMLADMGADVVSITRTTGREVAGVDPLGRGRRRLMLDLKAEAGLDAARRLIDQADVLVEGYRPGVTERLGLGPEDCLARNPRLVYGRMTGWGQDGPMAPRPGHDINYIALAGALAHFGRAGGPPTPPINMVGDFGGGGMLLAFGVVCALLERERSGRGQVVDAAMIDGAASLMAFVWGFYNRGAWRDDRGTNLLDTGAPFYDTYECADGQYVSLGSNERPFFEEMMRRVGLDPDEYPDHMVDQEAWPRLREQLTPIMKSKTRDEWRDLLEGTDCCFAPVLTMSEAFDHPHIRARGTLIEDSGFRQPAPAPRFSRTPGAIQHHEEQGPDALLAWGFSADEVEALRAAGAAS
jgi:alpha-methylacyl-CoA racemase